MSFFSSAISTPFSVGTSDASSCPILQRQPSRGSGRTQRSSNTRSLTLKRTNRWRSVPQILTKDSTIIERT